MLATISVFHDGDMICATATSHGDNIQEAPTGFGPTVGDALRALADEMDKL